MIFVTGISGSGKSTFIDTLDNNTLKIQADNYRKLQPQINEYIRKFGRYETYKNTGNFSFNFALRDKAIEKRANVIFEATFPKLDTAQSIIKPFQDNGYNITIITFLILCNTFSSLLPLILYPQNFIQGL